MDKIPPERLNLRIPGDVKAGLQAYADSLGVSLNAAAILAIRNFLPFAMKQANQLGESLQHVAATPRAVKPQPSNVPRKAPPILFRKVGRNELCPCLSGRKAKHCHPEWT